MRYNYKVRHIFLLFALFDAMKKKGRYVDAGDVLIEILENPERYKKVLNYNRSTIGRALSNDIDENHVTKKKIIKNNKVFTLYHLTDEGKEYINKMKERWGLKKWE